MDDKAERYDSSEFKPNFLKDLQRDLDVLEEIQAMWNDITDDPKIDEFIRVLNEDKNLRNNKILVFTESKETAFYLEEKLNKALGKVTLAFSGDSGESMRRKVIKNFDAKERNQEN